jgi:hypothetical protein
LSLCFFTSTTSRDIFIIPDLTQEDKLRAAVPVRDWRCAPRRVASAGLARVLRKKFAIFGARAV